MTKVKVRSYVKQDGTHVRNYAREQSSSLGSSSELPPEDEYAPESNAAEDMSGEGDSGNARATETKTKPKEDDGGNRGENTGL